MPTTTDALARIHTLARAQAQALRDEAITDFWRGADALVADAGHGAYRSAQRLAYRLARRTQDLARQAELASPRAGA